LSERERRISMEEGKRAFSTLTQVAAYVKASDLLEEKGEEDELAGWSGHGGTKRRYALFTKSRYCREGGSRRAARWGEKEKKLQYIEKIPIPDGGGVRIINKQSLTGEKKERGGGLESALAEEISEA